MQDIFSGPDDLNAKARAMVKSANELGGPDNISVVLVERISI
jgi:serine/threonine protein phosphatase PrpC